MTDIEAFKAMLARAKIEFHERKGPAGLVTISVEGDQAEPRLGYSGFYAMLAFSVFDGSLVNLGAAQ